MENKSWAIYRFVLRRPYSEIMIKLLSGKMTIKDVVDFSGMCYQRIAIIMQEFDKEGIINREQKDNKFNISLTEKGKMFANLMLGVKMVVESWDDSVPVKISKMLYFDESKKDEDGIDSHYMDEENNPLSAVIIPPEDDEPKKVNPEKEQQKQTEGDKK